jgi:hypothetical protein
VPVIVQGGRGGLRGANGGSAGATRFHPGVPTEATSAGSGAGGSGDPDGSWLGVRFRYLACGRDRHRHLPARGQTQAVSNIIAPTRPRRQWWEWGSSWLAKISGDALTVTAESTTTALPACSSFAARRERAAKGGLDDEMELPLTGHPEHEPYSASPAGKTTRARKARVDFFV